jgi:hypothetical protein
MLLFLAEPADQARVDAVVLELSGYEVAGAIHALRVQFPNDRLSGALV